MNQNDKPCETCENFTVFTKQVAGMDVHSRRCLRGAATGSRGVSVDLARRADGSCAGKHHKPLMTASAGAVNAYNPVSAQPSQPIYPVINPLPVVAAAYAGLGLTIAQAQSWTDLVAPAEHSPCGGFRCLTRMNASPRRNSAALLMGVSQCGQVRTLSVTHIGTMHSRGSAPALMDQDIDRASFDFMKPMEWIDVASMFKQTWHHLQW